jgi:septal ring factor EnvC (AmiA/AmiB activator)
VQRSVPLRRSAPGSPTRPAMINGKVGKVEKLEATVAQQQKQIETLTAQLKEQAAQIEKVSAQLATASPSRGGLEMSKPAPKVVVNKP